MTDLVRPELEGLGRYKFGWADPDEAGAIAQRGLSEEVVRNISALKNEPEWMLDMRLKGLRLFEKKPMPHWGADLSGIDFDNIKYFVRSTEKQATSWDELPVDIKNTYDKLGIPEAEKQRLIAGVAAQYECIWGGALVWTANRGQVPIKEIEPGDRVFAYDETDERFVIAPVKAAAQTGTKQTYQVKVGGRTIRATDNHPFLVVRDDIFRWVAVAGLQPGDFVAVVDASRVDAMRAQALVPAGADHGAGIEASVGRPDRDLVLAVEPYAVEPVYDIEVDGPHNFVVEGLVVHNSEVVYHQIREDLEAQGVLFLDTDSGLREHEDLFREYFASVIPAGDNKFAALNTAVWSGGSFIYVPKGVHVDIPLQAYFRINTENMGQFERTLIIADEGSYVHYVEGCTAPVYSSDSLHSAVVEIVVKKDARVRYTTIQNWSNNVYNLVTKRAMAHEGATMEWVDGNLGCLAQGSTVTTPSGVKPIEELVPGEQVLSFDDDTNSLVFRRVVAKKFSGAQPVREVRIGERRLRVTDNHPFLSYTYDPMRARKSGRYRFAYVRADHLAEAIVPRTSIDYGEPHKLEQPDLRTDFVNGNQYGEGFAASRTRARRVHAPETTTDDLMWLFGAFLGDGSIDSKSGVGGGRRWAKVTFSVPLNDRARPRLDRVMSELAPGIAPTQRADGIAVTWNSVELAELIAQNGFGGSAPTKRLPEWVLSLPESQRLELVAGVLDTDGCAPLGRRGFGIKSVNAALLRDVAQVLTSLGITSRLQTEFDGERDVIAVGRAAVAHGAHRLEFRCDPRLVDRVSPKLRAAALAQPLPQQIHHRTIGRSSLVVPEPLEVRKVGVSAPLETVPTWDIEVEGTGNFISQGFVVHNSKITMKYPAVWLVGEHAKGETLSVAFAGEGQHQDAGAKMVHAAPNTSSSIVSKSVARGGGRTSYRGLVQINKNSHHAKSTVKCDALLIDNISRSDTYPYVDVREDDVQMGHEATVSKVSADQLFYLMSRGVPEDEAMAMIVRGFIEPIARELPMEYALELNRLIELQMEGAVG
jgi:Fe-S cluster assembly scaffold protein SufB